jgi:hypothetical protein
MTIQQVIERLKEGYCLLPQMEEWKPINGYEGLYEISQYARVRRLGGLVIKSNGIELPIRGRILGSYEVKSGYLINILSANKKQTTYYVHHLVWDHFGNSFRMGKKIVVDHKIENNKKDCTIYNLQAITNRDNAIKYHLGHKKGNLPTGVRQRKCGTYQAIIKINKKAISLGTFNNPIEAGNAYQINKIRVQA